MNEDIAKLKATVKFVKELNFTDEEIHKYYYKIIQINEDLTKCENSTCEECINEDGLHEVFYRDVNNKLSSTLIKCPKSINNGKSNFNNYLIKEFDHLWDNLLFNKTNVDVKSMSRKFVVKELWDQLRNKEFKNIYVYNKKNVGKTYLFALFCNNLAKLNKKICFINFSKLLLDVECNNNLDNYKDIIYKLNNCDVLVIDNLGLEKFNSHLIIEKLLPVITARKNRGLPTYFTSYLSLEQLELKYINDVKSINNSDMKTKINLHSFKELIKKFINTIRSSLDRPEFLLEENI